MLMSTTTASPAGAGLSCSFSAIVGSTTWGCHHLKIDGYSSTKHVPNGTPLKSRPFLAAGLTWYIKFYPNGVSQACTDSVSLFLVLDDDIPEAVVVRLRVNVVDQAGKPVTSNGWGKALEFFKQSSWGYASFIKREYLEKSGLLKNDSFTILWEVVVVNMYHGVDTEAAAAPSVVVPPSDWPQHFGDLLSSEGLGTDVRFEVGTETFVAHRCVLAARSPVFRAELFGSMKESIARDIIRIDDIEPQAFSALLRFIYTDALPEMDEQEEAAAMAQHLLVAADRYGMDRLKLVCEDRLCRHIHTGTAAATLALAEQHHCLVLKEVCLEFLTSRANLNEVMATDDFDHLTRSCPDVLKELMSRLAAR